IIFNFKVRMLLSLPEGEQNIRTISLKYAIIILPFKGVQAIQDSPGLGERGIYTNQLKTPTQDLPKY
ncbi:MAG: hypothetical protein WB511_13665, partial [Nitrososphaeraceae archaeon]